MDSGIQHFALTGMSEMSCVVLFIKESLLCGFSLGSISQGFRLHMLLCPVLYIGNGKKTQSRNSTVAEEQWQVLWSFMWSSRQLLLSLWSMLMQRGKESRAATDWTELGVSLLFRYLEYQELMEAWTFFRILCSWSWTRWAKACISVGVNGKKVIPDLASS